MTDFDFGPTAFVRVYRLPEKLTVGFCFGPGVPITFVNVDWFEAPLSFGKEKVEEFIKTKKYYHLNYTYLVLSDDPKFTFTIGEVKR
jgi:hypothetical protein